MANAPLGYTAGMSAHFLPPSVPLSRLNETLASQGFALLDGRSVQQWLDVPPQELARLQPTWDDLPSDQYLKDGGRYRQRRHSCFVVDGEQPWYVEAHQFRIDTTDGIGRPTPEGAHRDGMELVAVFLVGRHRIKGGESRVFEAHGPNGQRFTLTEPWSLLLLDDERVIHETTPIQPADPESIGWRDTLVITCRSGGFQGD